VKKIRVLIVDDSTVIRRLLSDSLNADPALEVIDTAAHGRIALAKIAQTLPDVVTLDMEMPEMDGLATLTEIRKLYPKLPVIMFSTLTQRGAESTFEAIARGASDYVTKPANVGSVTAAMQNVREQLIPKIKQFCPWVNPSTSIQPNRRTFVTQATKVATVPSRVEIIVVGSSTGGPNALAAVLSKLPSNFPVPVLIAQHMPPIFTSHLASRLGQVSPLRVREAAANDLITPGGVWVAPGNYHLTVRRSGTSAQTSINQAPPENSCRPSVDVLFRSAAEVYGPNTLAVVLTGMGQDGMRGARNIREKGGEVLIQDEATSVVWGMPGAVWNAGLANQTLPLSKIADAIVSRVGLGRNLNPRLNVGAQS
jgi:two-component system chemotaxis response regulator CheB